MPKKTPLPEITHDALRRLRSTFRIYGIAEYVGASPRTVEHWCSAGRTPHKGYWPRLRDLMKKL